MYKEWIINKIKRIQLMELYIKLKLLTQKALKLGVHWIIQII